MNPMRMILNVRRSGLLLTGLVLALTACGSPGDHLSFKAPSMYQAPKNMFGMAQIWSTADSRQALMLMKLPMKMDPKHAVVNAGVNNASVKSQQAIKICGSQPATHIVMESTGKNHNMMDMVMTSSGGTSYMAMYSHPVGTPADRASEDAIRSLCAV